MTELYKAAAAHVIRAYLLEKVQSILGWTNVNGLAPIIPNSQEPELTNADKPFIVYGYSTAPYGVMWELCVENIAFTIYSDDQEDINKAVNLIIDLFRRFDWSAAEINTYIGSSSVNLFKNFDIKFTQVTASSADGPSQEGGRRSGFVSIRVEYSHNLDNSGLRAQVAS